MKNVLLTMTFLLIAGLAAAAEPRTAPVAVGEMPPDFTLKDQDGRAAQLSASRGERPVVAVFYRGHW